MKVTFCPSWCASGHMWTSYRSGRHQAHRIPADRSRRAWASPGFGRAVFVSKSASTSGVTSNRKKRAMRAAAIIAALGWAFVVGASAQYVWRYQSTPGTFADAPAAWPHASSVTRRQGEPVLIMFVHPQCTCSRASLEEFSRILERNREPVAAWVLFLRPSGTTEEWENTPSWEAARRLPGVRLLVDREGAEATRFGASTSGHTVLYDGNGQLLFAGGITGARGHVGANSGAQSLSAHLSGAKTGLHQHDVFGCAFHDLAKQGPGS
jgi:hypothetical protein